MNRYLLLFLSILSTNVYSQSFDLGSWNILNVKFNVNNNWSLFGETQLRSLKFYNNFHYYEYKGGISYKIQKNVNLTLGAGSYQTYKEGGNFILPKNNRNRFRYRVGLSYPFGKEKNKYQPFQISASEEIFFTDREPYFERNRVLVAFNYKPSKATSIQIGYLHQFDYKINDETGRDFLQIGYFIVLNRKTSRQ